MIPILFKFILLSIAMAVFSSGVIVYFKNRSGYLNRLIFLCALVVAYRLFCEGEMRTAGSFNEAVFWANAGFLRPFALALFLHFMLYYTGFWHSLDRFSAYALIYLPAMLFSLAFLTLYDMQEMIARTGTGWVFKNAFPTPLEVAHLYWAILVGLAGIGLCIAYYAKAAADERGKVQIAFIILTGVLLSAVVIGLLKRFGVIDLIQLNGLIIPAVALILGFMVLRSRIAVTPALAVEEILSSMEDGLLIVGKDGRLIEANRAALSMTGYAEPELRENPAKTLGLVDFPAPAHHPPVDSSQPVAQADSIVTTKDGTALPVRLAAVSVRDCAGYYLARVVLMKNLSAQKAVEQELMKAQKLEAFTMLTKSVSHDFNNLLGLITMRLSMFDSDTSLPARVKDDLTTTKQTAFLAADLLREFGSFFQDTPLTKTACDIGPILKKAADIVTCGSRTTITIGCPGSLPPIDGVRQQLIQVFLNLFINARQAMDKNGTIAVDVKYSGIQNNVTITVKDNGCGITREVAEQIFKPFYTTKPGGSGLGLAIVASIIKSHNGSIAVSSAPGSGTTFTIILPASSGAPRDEPELVEGGVTGARQ